MDKATRKRLSEIVRELDGPVGPVPFERVITRHLAFFVELRQHGSTWEQIVKLLATEGARRPDGRPFPAAHLRGVISRQLRKLAVRGRQEDRDRYPDFNDIQSRSEADSPAPAISSKLKKESSHSVHGAGARRGTTKQPARTSGPSSKPLPSDADNIRAFMKRAERLRRNDV